MKICLLAVLVRAFSWIRWKPCTRAVTGMLRTVSKTAAFSVKRRCSRTRPASPMSALALAE